MICMFVDGASEASIAWVAVVGIPLGEARFGRAEAFPHIKYG